MDKEPFIYTISSEERINTNSNGPIYNIMFGGFNSQYDNFKCEVLSASLSTGFNTALGYMLLTATNLHDNGLFCHNMLQSDTCIVSVISTNPIAHNAEICFNIKNCRVPRLVRFTLLKSTFTNPIGGADINQGANQTNWMLVLKLTPII